MSSKMNDKRDSTFSAGSSVGYDGQPPDYAEHAPQQEPPADLSARLASLDLNPIAKNGVNVTPDQCIAHLKLLEAFYILREEIGNVENLFGIASPPLSEKDSEVIQETQGQNPAFLAQVRIREKRWAVFVARAVDRFEKWWDSCVPATLKGAPCEKLTGAALCGKEGLVQIDVDGEPIVQLGAIDYLPPIDVLMVWHSYMLNPRNFFEDCYRYGKMDFFATPMPWASIDKGIDIVTFIYTPTLKAVSNFEQSTGLKWDNLEDDMSKSLFCPTCAISISVPWTDGSAWLDTEELNPGTGYADAGFTTSCMNCKTAITHDALRVQKFKTDMQACLRSDIPMPGTVLGVDGIPDAPVSYLPDGPSHYFPNVLIKKGVEPLLPLVFSKPSSTIDDIKDVFEEAIKDKALLIGVKGRRKRLMPKERLAIRKMLSRYWFNSSPFALDLSGAVIRQGSFVEKMHNIDWLHSPALESTMKRLLTKYARFFALMVEYPRQVAVPTLDVDLAWHTHQLDPKEYYRYSYALTKKYIDHDDKIEETALSDGFTWTSKTYASKYKEPYSECTCWYCEAIRESHTSTLSRVFKTSSATTSEKLHSANLPSDPLKSVHISAHNAVRNSESDAKSRVKAAELDKAYQRACANAKKKGNPVPQRDAYFYSYAWGYPMYMPMYYPYAVPIGYGGGGGGVYCSDPCSVNSCTGAYGACAAGTCGGMAAAGGSCGGASGGCAGGCGGGAGGGCGGGGGGGCGGGGGGGGCGGGGGS
ncbi:hypothetical protein EJ08DRAFT_719442 [Tothia fuscella]|uniref:Uncharacterized protein n=1 Tax=Tothia fuscella TaxID=1048955 RepID=A0A9P4NNX6_9PEZI|nr:hypothetical protein EJ08DRAFT_719442 [Tothia fuscella]